jgi:uncharacterized integral membrane protein
VMAFHIGFTFPVVGFPVRVSFDHLVCESFEYQIPSSGETQELFFQFNFWYIDPESKWCCRLAEEDSEDNERTMNLNCGCCTKTVTKKSYRLTLESFVIVLLVLVLAISIPQVDVVFNFVGGTFSGATAFIFPGFFYYRVRDSDPNPATWKTVGALALVAFGVLVASFTTFAIIYDSV